MSCEKILQLGINRKNASCVTLWCRCSYGRWSRRPLCRSPNCWNIGGGHEDEDIKHDHDRITIYLSNLFNTGQFCKTWYYVLILLWSDSVNMPSVIKCNECEKSSPQKFPWGRAGPKSAGHWNFPTPLPQGTDTVLCRLCCTCHCQKLKNAFPIVHPPPFFRLCAPHQNILYHFSLHCL